MPEDWKQENISITYVEMLSTAAKKITQKLEGSRAG